MFIIITILSVMTLDCRLQEDNQGDSLRNILTGSLLSQELAVPSECLSSATGLASIDSVIDTVYNTYGIQICMNATLPPIVSATGLTSVDYPELETAVLQFQTELARLPQNYVQSWNLKTVLFAKNISMLGNNLLGLSISGSSIVLYELYISASYRKLLIHHEIFHHIDSVFSGNRIFYDDVWNGYNIGDNLYDGSYLNCYSDAGQISYPMTGFLNYYSFCSMTEDKAEVYALQFDSSTNIIIGDLILSGDTVLEQKVNHVRNMAEVLSPDMDTAFWNALNP